MSAHSDAEFADLERTIDALRQTLAERETALASGAGDYAERIAYQAATTDVLKLMAESPGDPQPVFDLIVERARDLCDAYGASVWEYDGTLIHLRASNGVDDDPTVKQAIEAIYPMVPSLERPIGRAILERRIIRSDDFHADQDLSPIYRIATVRSGVLIPLMRGDKVIGGLGIGSRERGGFSESQEELLKTFAEQAVIAITSAETYRTLQVRTADLREALEQQTATSDVLKVISRSTFDLQPVLDTVCSTAARLSEADTAVISTREGDLYRLVAIFSTTPSFEAFVRNLLLPADRASVAGRTALEAKTVHVIDVTADPEYKYPETGELGKIRSALGVPLLRDGVVAGTLFVARHRVEPFTERQIELVSTFADQAVIAIENTRLLTEQREALERQTATAEILAVINTSPGDLTPVFHTILEKAMRLCGAAFGGMSTWDGQRTSQVARLGYPPALAEHMRVRGPVSTISPVVSRLLETSHTQQLADLTDGEGYRSGHPDARALGDLGGARTLLTVPLLKDATLLGYITVYRQEVRLYTDKEIALLEGFAAQAVIAMENARLLGELRERTEELALRNSAFSERIDHQAATIEVLKEMSASPGDAEPVFDLICRQAKALLDTPIVAMLEYDGYLVHLRANPGVEDLVDKARYATYASTFPMVPDRGSLSCRAILDGTILHIRDLDAEPGIAETVRVLGHKTQVTIPLMRDGHVIGAISAASLKVDAISDTQIELLKTFAEQAVIAIGSAETYRALQTRTADLQESLTYQTATSDVLKAISRSTFDLQPVLDTLLTTAARLCEADNGFLMDRDGDMFRAKATFAVSSSAAAILQSLSLKMDRGTVTGRAALEGRAVQIDDVTADPDYALPATVSVARNRTVLGVPLLRQGVVVGAITLGRQRMQAFTDQQIALVSTFADQAVIAIENTRLITEQREALEQQTATAEVLGVINRSPGDLAPVFDALLDKATRLIAATSGSLFTYDGERVHRVVERGAPAAWMELSAATPSWTPGPDEPLRRLLLTKHPVMIPDLLDDGIVRAGDAGHLARVEIGRVRAALSVPLLKDTAVVGIVSVYRDTPGPFSGKQIALLENFAAQAVIAMENARLLGELRERTEELAERNEAFGERIEHQSATIDVLKAMSASPGDPRPVFDLICRQARTLLNGPNAGLFEYDGELVHYRADSGTALAADAAGFESYKSGFPMAPVRGSLTCRAILDGEIIHIRDLTADPEISEAVRQLGHRSQISVPLMRDGHAIGAISMGSWQAGGFSDSQVDLLKTFAEQAVIAIGSAETYRALRERTAALAQRNSEFGERIEQQAATIDVLKVMSSTPDDTQPVFDQIVRRATELCNGVATALFEYDGELVHFRVLRNQSNDERHLDPTAYESYKAMFPMVPTRGSISCRAILDRKTYHVRDMEADPDISEVVRALARAQRSQLSIPLLRDGRAIGCITLAAAKPGGFTDSQVSLLHTFAEQAVIAITSVANFRALRERTAELTRSVAELQALEEVLRAVNSSLDLDTVLETIISRAVTLSRADEGTIYEFDDAEEVFLLKATHGMTETRVARLREARIKLGDTYLGRAGLRREPVHVSDLQLDPTLPEGTKEALHDIHAVLAVPLLRQDKVLGGLVIRRRTTGDFPTTIPTLLQTFAAQSVLAIENARLFQDARRARLAAEATLTDLRRTQDRLVQTEKMASLGQLTAGIAHEIKNPLNFVNNFSDLSVDLLTELNEAVAPDKVTVADDLRAEIDEITATLKGNLERIAQHGRRADSIVKNMLLHSRTGPSEHREIDLNAMVEEALNLAYHGARAETPGFNITLEKHLDPAAGVIDAFPQEFTRVMLNLMSNGFYAARTRLATAPAGFEPTLTVTTASLGDTVKIRVRDNGTGMPDTVRDKIFEPFFTTKPAGEGTGLGLSLSFDIVVKQHGGQLTVDSKVDTFTEFTVTLPRRVVESPRQ